MPKNLTKFREDWLDSDDKNGGKISQWCVKGHDDFSAYCTLCKATVNISNSGKIQLIQHAKTSKHKKMQVAETDVTQTRFVFSEGNNIALNSNSTAGQKKPWILNSEDSVSKSEIIWIIHAALHNYSYLSHDSIKEVFTSVFPDSQLCSAMTLSSTKVAYSISHGLAPYFLKQISDEFAETKPYYTLMFDETLNEQNLKQLDVYVRFWSASNNGISERYLGTELLGHATALNIFNGIKSILKSHSINMKKLLMLGSDGPNVNKLVFQLANNEVKSIGEHGLINVGTCNLHVIHNAFGKGVKIEDFGNIVDFLENIHSWFSKFPSRKEDLQKQIEAFNCEFSKVLRFVSNRWLSVVPVCERILILLPALEEYFLKDLPTQKSSLLKLERYASIKKAIEDPLLFVHLHFLISVGSMFEQILKLLQQKNTLIHILHNELSDFLLKIMRRFVNEEALKGKRGEKLLEIDIVEEALPLKKIDVGNNARKALAGLGSEKKEAFLLNAKKFYIAIFEYLSIKLPLKNKLLQALQILHPIARKESVTTTLPIVRRLCNMLPQVIPTHCVDKITDEWHIYANDDDIIPEEPDSCNIDKYWNYVFSMKDGRGTIKYPFLMSLIKAALTFSHGQASVERGFSVNKRVLTCEKSRMSLDTLVGLRVIKDSVAENAANVDVTKEMINFYKQAHSKYKAQKQKEKMKEMNEKSLDPKKNQPLKKSTAEQLKGLKEKISSAQAMIEEGNQRLKVGLKRKSMSDIEAAQALIDAGNKKLKAAQQEQNTM